MPLRFEVWDESSSGGLLIETKSGPAGSEIVLPILVLKWVDLSALQPFLDIPRYGCELILVAPLLVCLRREAREAGKDLKKGLSKQQRCDIAEGKLREGRCLVLDAALCEDFNVLADEYIETSVDRIAKIDAVLAQPDEEGIVGWFKLDRYAGVGSPNFRVVTTEIAVPHVSSYPSDSCVSHGGKTYKTSARSNVASNTHRYKASNSGSKKVNMAKWLHAQRSRVL